MIVNEIDVVRVTELTLTRDTHKVFEGRPRGGTVPLKRSRVKCFALLEDVGAVVDLGLTAKSSTQLL